jgi:hypothetical protein
MGPPSSTEHLTGALIVTMSVEPSAQVKAGCEVQAEKQAGTQAGMHGEEEGRCHKIEE